MRSTPANANPSKTAKSLSIAFLCALVTTVALLSLMQMLVTGSDNNAEQSKSFHFVDFVGNTDQEKTIKKKVKPQKPIQEPQPSRKIINNMTASQLKILDNQPSNISILDEMELSPESMSLIKYGGDMVPRVKVAPVYPPRALNRGIEGNCVIEFTVMADGSVSDVSEVADKCDALFSSASLRAVEKFKYKPRIENGVPVTVTGIRNKFVYRLEK